MSAPPRLRVLSTDEVEPELLDELTALCEAAFDESFASAWERVGPGVHVIASDTGGVAAHAMIVDRRLYLGHEPDQALDAGYVEHVATRPEIQGQGHGTAVMREINRLIEEDYAIGALSTGANGFYQGLGWETWRGPTFVRMLDGQRVRSVDDDGGVMVLRTARTPADLDLDGPIAVDWRPEEAW
ncbi:MAG TPA: GNAT family N-acetyltransferase [Candidatus Limnocylindrales bacterium]|nr:GNAT family N-acetyltransferase [Candidatus Limnocylindrales bacterium]